MKIILQIHIKLEVVNSVVAAAAASSRPASIASCSSAQFHLPELKSNVEIYNNISKEDASSSSSQPKIQSVNTSIAPPANLVNSNPNSVSTPTVNPPALSSAGPTSASSSSSCMLQFNSDEFVQRLIEAVHKQPCLYNPNHEHYGNKHASAQYRANVWQNLCQELEYTDEPHSLQIQWKRIRDRYVRERRKRKLAGVDGSFSSALKNQNPANQSAAARHFDSMRWIDEFLSDSSSNSSPSLIGNTNGDINSYYSQHPNRRRTVLAINGEGVGQDGLSANRPYDQNSGLMRTPVNTAKNESTNGSPSSTSSEISVGSTQLQNNGQTHLMYRSKEDVGSLHAVTPNSHPALSSVSAREASYQLVSVPQQQVVPNSSKNMDQSIMTMIIGDGHGANTAFYQHQPNNSGTQKMYRLVPANELNAQQQQQHHQPVLHHQASVLNPHEMQLVQSPSQAPRRKKLALGGGGNRTTHLISNEGGILEANTLIGGSPQQTQLVIEQDRILINNQQPPTQHMVVSQHQQIHPSSSSHLQHGSSIQRIVGAQRGIHNNGRNSSGSVISDLHHLSQTPQQQHLQQQSQQHYILSAPQQHYDPESALIETIVRHLGNLNDDEKVVTKMNIQRILMDARFGRGACVRMFREEEQSENMAAMENQRHLQQQNNARR